MRLLSLIAISLMFISIRSEGCWKGTYSRGVGTPLNSCPADKELQASLCYAKCPSGYKGVGPVCW
jgi:hypothetical protein